MKKLSLLILLFGFTMGFAQHVAINGTGAPPDAKSMLDIASTTSGLLIPRMTTAERDLISSPPNGLEVYNTTTNTLDIYRSTRWESAVTSPASNLVYVYSLSDLPTPSGDAITLNPAKMYVFSGFVNISPNYININGAGLRGTDPSRDGVLSNVSGAVLRSTDLSLFMENVAVVPAGASTQAYDFRDGTGTMLCTMLSGCSVVELPGVPSLGVGQITGFRNITIFLNYWRCTNGLKIGGAVGKFAATNCYITNLTTGEGLEFLSGLTIDEINLSNNHFIYPGLVGIKVNTGVTVNSGRMTTNMFSGVGTNLAGIDSYTYGWKMAQNTGIPDSRALCFAYMSGNATATPLTTASTFYKINGTTTMVNEHRFTAGNDNRMTYTGQDPITARVLVIIGAHAPANNSDFSIAIAKNGTVIPLPFGSMAAANNGTSFQIVLATEVDLTTNDYVEVWIRKNNTNTTTVTVEEMQFRVTD